MKPQKYVKQPVTVEAMLWDGAPEGATEIIDWILDHDGDADYFAPGEWDGETDATYIRVRTLEGNMLASPGDYVIRGVEDEFYPCKPDIFRRTYAPESEAEEVFEAKKKAYPHATLSRAVEKSADDLIRSLLSAMGKGPESDPVIAVRSLVKKVGQLQAQIDAVKAYKNWNEYSRREVVK